MPDDPNGRTWQELRNLRERVERLSSRAAELLYITRANRSRLDRLEPKVDAIATADAIAEGVADKLDEREHESESRLRVWSIRVGIVGATVAGVIAILDLIARF
ncbi:MAG TPA: hypothetical protein VIM33_04925 [Gaiellaceae bacterium]|jgi:uncharacterized protein YigA (DUF484 family)